MNIHVSEAEAKKRAARVGLAIADADVHPALANPKALHPYLAQRWRDHMDAYGMIPRHQYQAGPAYPKGNPDASRRDAYPPEGGRPGSSLSFMRAQHLDPNNVELGILNPLAPTPGNAQNLELSAALATAMNEWQLAEWMEPEPRLKGSIMPPYEDAAASVTEINRWAGNPHFAQILLLSRTAEPLGQRRYWPIYEAAAAHDLPVAIHAFGYGGNPVTSSGWPSFYNEEHHTNAHSVAAQLTSLVLEGVPERFPSLNFVFIEGGFGWVPATTWRMDQQFEHFRDEVPHLKRRPSEYVKEQFWFTTQPSEEPDNSAHLRQIIDWIGVDRLIFSSDYPHWDYDDPRYAIKTPLADDERAKIFRGNAHDVYAF